jgi:uncharacterized BrkB/YihY/UPF0761 family membrane protein
MKITGLRTLFGGLAGYATLAGCFYLVPPEQRGPAYVFLSGGVGVVLGFLAGKAAVGLLSSGTGVQGAKAALMTSAKPGDPPPDSLPPTPAP